MKYHVLLSRLVEQQCEVEVDAPDQEAAGDKALELDNVVELAEIPVIFHFQLLRGRIGSHCGA